MKKSLQLILMLFSTVLVYAQPEPVEHMVVYKATSEIMVDGIKDEAYRPLQSINNTTNLYEFDAGKWDGQMDLSAEFTIAYRNDGIYTFHVVTDDTVGAATDFEGDGIELYFNAFLNDTVNGSYGDDAIQIFFRSLEEFWGWNSYTRGGSIDNNSGEPDGYLSDEFAPVFTHVKGENGNYNLEAFVPWEMIFDTVPDDLNDWLENNTMGFDIHYIDDDESERDHMLVWDADGEDPDSDRAWLNTEVFGEITFGGYGVSIDSTVERNDTLYTYYPNYIYDTIVVVDTQIFERVVDVYDCEDNLKSKMTKPEGIAIYKASSSTLVCETDPELKKIEIYAPSGILKFSVMAEGTTDNIYVDLSDLVDNGHYYIRFIYKDESKYTTKIINQ